MLLSVTISHPLTARTEQTQHFIGPLRWGTCCFSGRPVWFFSLVTKCTIFSYAIFINQSQYVLLVYMLFFWLFDKTTLNILFIPTTKTLQFSFTWITNRTHLICDLIYLSGSKTDKTNREGEISTGGHNYLLGESMSGEIIQTFSFVHFLRWLPEWSLFCHQLADLLSDMSAGVVISWQVQSKSY